MSLLFQGLVIPSIAFVARLGDHVYGSGATHRLKTARSKLASGLASSREAVKRRSACRCFGDQFLEYDKSSAMIRFHRSYLPVIAAPLAATLLAVAVLFGGASRIDLLPPIVVRISGLIVIAWLIWAAVPATFARDRLALLIWAGLFLVPLVQLVPLPWGLWSELPGRALARDVNLALGQTPWHGLSLTPDRTLNGLLALIPAFAAWLLGRRLDETGQNRLFAVVALLAVASAFLGLMQRAGGSGSALYLYAITNDDSSVGIFSNANHHSLFLCCGVVAVLFWLAGTVKASRGLPPGKTVIALCALAIIGASVLATSSRAGVMLLPVALLAGLAMIPFSSLGIGPVTLRISAALVAGVGALGVALLLNGTFGKFGLENSVIRDGRLDNIPLFARIVKDQFPYGSGLGSFDPVFRGYEATRTLGISYLNNAHNDYAQVLIEAGVAGMALLALFALWYVRRVLPLWLSGVPKRAPERVVWASAAMVTLLLIHSAVDYPLRTAALSVLFGFCAAFLAPPLSASGRQA